MKLTGCVGIREGFRFQYQNLVGEGRVTEARTGHRNMFIFRVRPILRKGTRTTKPR